MSEAADPCVIFSHQLPDSLLSAVAASASASASASSSPIFLIHSFYRRLKETGSLSVFRLRFLPLLWDSYLTLLSRLHCSPSSQHGERLPSLFSFLSFSFQLPAAVVAEPMPDNAAAVLDVACCAYLSYSLCLSNVKHVFSRSRLASASPLSAPLLTAVSSCLHLLDLLLHCEQLLQSKCAMASSVAASPPLWLPDFRVLQQLIHSLERPEPLLLLHVIHLAFSVPADAVDAHCLLRSLYDSAYSATAAAGSGAAAASFTETGFFSLLHLSLRCLQLLALAGNEDGFDALSSSAFITAQTAVQQMQTAAPRFSAPVPPTASFASFSSSSFSSSSSASSLPSSSSSSCAERSVGSVSVQPLDLLIAPPPSVAAFVDGVLRSLMGSCDALCQLERENRKEYPQLAAAHSAFRRSRPPPALALLPAVSAEHPPLPPPPSDKEEKKEEAEEDALLTPFRRRLRRRSSRPKPLEADPPQLPALHDPAQPLVDGTPAVVAFILPDVSGRLMVADCLSLLSGSDH